MYTIHFKTCRGFAIRYWYTSTQVLYAAESCRISLTFIINRSQSAKVSGQFMFPSKFSDEEGSSTIKVAYQCKACRRCHSRSWKSSRRTPFFALPADGAVLVAFEIWTFTFFCCHNRLRRFWQHIRSQPNEQAKTVSLNCMKCFHDSSFNDYTP